VPPDTLVLGCTHFPLLTEVIAKVVGKEVRIIDSAETTARVVAQTLAAANLTCDSGKGTLRLLATDGQARFARVGAAFLGREIRADQVELVDLEDSVTPLLPITSPGA
jgi:glutamate racemase